MRRRLTRLSSASNAEEAFERLLAALETELIAATDAEIADAARDLGMNLEMKGSGAFIGLKYPSRTDLAAFFDTDWHAQLRGPGNDDSGPER